MRLVSFRFRKRSLLQMVYTQPRVSDEINTRREKLSINGLQECCAGRAGQEVQLRVFSWGKQGRV